MEKKLFSKLFAISLLLSTPVFASEDGGDDVINREVETALQDNTVSAENAETVAEVSAVETSTEVSAEPATDIQTPTVENVNASDIVVAGNAVAGTTVAKQTLREKARARFNKTLETLQAFGVVSREEATRLKQLAQNMVRHPLSNKVNWAIAFESLLPAQALLTYRNHNAVKANDTSWTRWAKDRALTGAFFAFNVWLTAYTIKNIAALKDPRQTKKFAKEAVALATKLGIHATLSVPYMKSFFARWNKTTTTDKA